MNLAEVNELYRFLQGSGPKGFRLPKRPRLGRRAAFTIIYVLQERFRLIPDTIEQCDDCLDLFDTLESGSYDEKSGKHYCTSCEAHHPVADADETRDCRHNWMTSLSVPGTQVCDDCGARRAASHE